MRIARIIEYFPPHIGGMERHGLILSQEQIKLGHEVEVYIGIGGELKSDFGEFLKSDFVPKIYKMPLQFLPLYSRIRRFCFNFWAYNKIKRIHKKNPYDIIHIHGDFIESYFGGKLSKKIKIPAILTIHAGLNKRLLKPKNANCFKNIRKIICVSEEIANDLKSIDVPENKLAVISSGIYLVEFEKININYENVVDLQKQYSKPIIVSVGVLRINKGFGYLINAFKEVLNKFNSATLLIIGDGADRKYLESQAQGVSQIHFLGQQEHDKVVEYLYASDIFVLASISTGGDREGTPTSIMEAMAAGLPVVATKVGGNPYLIKDGVNGFLVSPGDSSELAEAINRLVNNREISQKMSMQNLEDIKQKDWPIITKLVNEVYESVL